MTISRPLQTTKFISKTGPGRPLGERHFRWVGCKKPELVGKRFGLVAVISPILRRIKGYVHVQTKCTQCGRIEWKIYANLLRAKTGCRSCALTKSKYQEVLGDRYDAIRQRCNTPHYPQYSDYGGRGIKCLFLDRAGFVKWVEENLPHPTYRGITIDRIENDGHYEPGNLRLATYSEQNFNRRNTAWMTVQGQRMLIHQFDSPYVITWTYKLAVERGMTGEEIIQHAQSQVTRRCKTWRKLATWLNAHGYMTL